LRTGVAERGKNMTKPFTHIAIALLSLIALLQLLRFVLAWEIVINGITIPIWASAIAFVIAAGLAVMVWREAQR